MSKYIAGAVHRGARGLVREADEMLQAALAEFGPTQKVAFPNTAYYLPTILGFMGHKVETLGDLSPVIAHCKELVHPDPGDRLWLPYLGETLDAGVATLLAAEAIEGIRFVRGLEPTPIDWGDYTYQATSSFTSPEFAGQTNKRLNGPIDDVQLRSWGIQLVDGRMPGFAAIVGCAKSNEVAVHIVRELQRRGILIFLSGNVNGRSIIHQLMEEGVQLGYDTFTVPFGLDTISAIYAIGFATRSALTFGGLKGGQAREILLYNKYRTFAFVLALGEVDDLKYAAAAGAINYGFPTIADTAIPPIYPTGVTLYEHVVPMPFDQIEGKDDLERAERLVQRCIEVRGVKIKITEVPIPVPYGSAFEGERVRREDMQVEFGGKKSRCFEYLRLRDMDEVEDHKIELIGPDIDAVPEGAAVDLGILVEVAGRKMQKDFEPILERQIHYFLNAASGVQHIGQRDIVWLRISKVAFEKGFRLKHFGEILYARLLDAFGTIVDKVQVTLITDPERMASLLEEARAAFQERNERLAGLTDEGVDTFYSCTLCVPPGQDIVRPDGSFVSVDTLIEEVVNTGQGEVLTFDHDQLTVRPIGELYINPAPAKLARIVLSNGNALTLTTNHKVLVDGPSGPDWVPAGKLRVGDYLVDARCTLYQREATTEPPFVVDYLSDDYKVSDDAFYARLREWTLARFESLGPAAEAMDLPYRRLYSALYEREEFSHQRLTLGEIKRALAVLGQEWDTVKGDLRRFQGGVELQRVRLDEDILYLAGLVAADGSVRWRGPDGRSGTVVQFTNTEPALTARFGHIVTALFGQPPQVYVTEPHTSASDELVIESKKPVSVSYVYNTLLGQLMAGLGIGQADRQRKWSGEVISTLSPDLVAAFLRGLFDGDGHVSGSRACFTTRSPEEARHAYLLLKKLGIASYITPITRGFQVATSTRQDLARFRERIGSEHPAKRARLETADVSSDEQHVVRTDVVSLGCASHLAALLDEFSDRLTVTQLPVDYKTLTAWTAGQRRASKLKLALLLEALGQVVPADHPSYQALVAWSQANVRFVRVKSVERVESPSDRVYNFSVEDTHNYLVNGIVVKNCQSFAPTHVCVVSPERLGLCGAYNWLDCRAAKEINPTGPNQPIPKGTCLDPVKGEFTGPNEFVYQHSQQTVERVTMYSIMDAPMTACGCFECIVMLIPEANGVMVVSREDPSMTPCGMTFSTLAGTAGGGLQTPGVMGVGKYYLTSKKFMSAEGGFKRVVWMSSFLKESMAEELKAVAEREGDPDLISKIADETICTDVDGLLPFLEEKGHPALTMDPIF